MRSEIEFIFVFQAEDGIRYAQESRGLGDVYKRQKSNYDWLNAMEKQYGKSGGGRLRIVAFPSFEFNDQEYHDSDFAKGFIRGTMGAVFDVVSVSPTPLHQCNSSTGVLYSRMMAEVNIPALSWNFDKFLLAPGGVVLDCLLYTSDAADEEDSVDLGGCRIIKKKNKRKLAWRE
eukprot:TRINITY_DN32355_c0_g1_i1.p1 TRINITY_DN32355_c0_g1~~TRINITY_DN32355_c0_g1_i1.p1  ORF type:complete len:174 (-),score=31.13 TRINITY_DN32355_c0_g1_i1:41-562(-)